LKYPVIKLFFLQTKYPSELDPGDPEHPSLIFSGTAEAYHS